MSILKKITIITIGLLICQLANGQSKIYVGVGLTRSDVFAVEHFALMHSDMFSNEFAFKPNHFAEVFAGASIKLGEQWSWSPQVTLSRYGAHVPIDQVDDKFDYRVGFIRLDNLIQYRFSEKWNFGLSPSLYQVFHASFKPLIGFDTSGEFAYNQMKDFILTDFTRFGLGVLYRLEYNLAGNFDLYINFYNDITSIGRFRTSNSKYWLNFAYGLGMIYRL